jgi:methylmalonyl-CoA/ethylmalonyl-CoA epimerase
MKVTRLDHVVFAVEEIDTAAEAWAHTFGLQAQPPTRPEHAPVELAMLPVGGESAQTGARTGAFLELVRALSDEHPLARAVAQRAEGMLSLSLEVEDLNDAVEELRAKGVAVSDPEPGLLPNTRVARFDPAVTHGVRLQLIERKGA